MIDKETLDRAFQLGRQAFKAGKSSACSQDPKFLDLIRGCRLGEGVAPMRAWVRGWTTENLKD